MATNIFLTIQLVAPMVFSVLSMFTDMSICFFVRYCCHPAWEAGNLDASFCKQGKHSYRIPTRTGKPGKWEGIFQSGKSQRILNRLEKSGKITQNTGKLREFEINII